jgi:hypothetical protein
LATEYLDLDDTFDAYAEAVDKVEAIDEVEARLRPAVIPPVGTDSFQSRAYEADDFSEAASLRPAASRLGLFSELKLGRDAKTRGRGAQRDSNP